MNVFGEITRKTIPPVYFFAALLAMVALAYFLPIGRIGYAPLRICGGILILAGLALTGTGAWSFKRAGTPVRPFELATTLVITGIYRYTRNPMYLGLLIILVGAWLALGKLSPVLVVPVFFVIIEGGFIRAEEEFLERTFGEKYLDYKNSVRRWF